MPAAQLAAAVADVCAALLAGGPRALAGTKRLLASETEDADDADERYVRLLEVSARHFGSAEAREGAAAFRGAARSRLAAALAAQRRPGQLVRKPTMRGASAPACVTIAACPPAHLDERRRCGISAARMRELTDGTTRSSVPVTTSVRCRMSRRNGRLVQVETAPSWCR